MKEKEELLKLIKEKMVLDESLQVREKNLEKINHQDGINKKLKDKISEELTIANKR